MYQELFEMFKAIHEDGDSPRLAQTLLDRVIVFTEADKGFIVVRDEGDFEERYQVHFDPQSRSENKRLFSRSLVRETIRSKQTILSRDVSEDERFEHVASVREMGPASVLVIPLVHEGMVHAAIYLERTGRPFGDRELTFAEEFMNLAGLSLHLAVEREALRRYKANREADVFERFDFGPLVTRHPSMLRLLEMVGRVAQADATVLIRGETGTGKELIAHALYKNSHRRKRPFVTLHCGALPETLLESELFGHKRGAFTGAYSDRAGRVSIANGGTLFIDEVAEIPLATQAKLLRFFQFGEFQRIGSDRTEKVDVRIVAATHADLAKMVAEGTFRADLYYRLKVIELQIPSLATRTADIPLLLDTFLKRHWPPRNGIPFLTPRLLELLMAHPFPGNIRELENLVERMCLLASGTKLDLELLPAEMLPGEAIRSEMGASTALPFKSFTNEELKAARRWATDDAVNRIEQEFLQGLLDRHQGNVRSAAVHAGMQRTYLYKLLAKHGMIAKT